MIRQLLRYLHLLFSLCLFAWGALACAQTQVLQVCPPSFPSEASADAAVRNQELGRLQSVSSACLLRADFYAYQGQLLLLQERFADALVAIERSLLLDSSRPGVQLDYVLALSKTGDADSARALAQQVLARDDVPSMVRAALEGVLRNNSNSSMEVLDRTPWQWRGHVLSMLGVDSNLNSATSADAINLTLPNGNVSLLLDGSSKPKSGHAWLAAGQLTGQANLDGGLLVVQGDWRERLAPGSHDFSYSQQDAFLLYRPYRPESWVPRIAVSNFSMGGVTLFTGLTATAWREYAGTNLSNNLSACTYRAGLEGERRTYAQDTTQNGFYGSVLGTLICTEGDNHYQWGVQTGRDWASAPYRAGGNQTRFDFKALWDRQWHWGRTTTEWVVSDLRDSNPYSDLLGGITRSALRQNLRISLTKRLNSEEKPNAWGGLYSVTVFEMLRHKSNLQLFDVRGESLYTGLRYEF